MNASVLDHSIENGWDFVLRGVIFLWPALKFLLELTWCLPCVFQTKDPVLSLVL